MKSHGALRANCFHDFTSEFLLKNMIIITKKKNEKYTAISPCGSTLIGPSSLNLILFCSIVCLLSFPLDKKKCTNNVRGILQIKKTKEKKKRVERKRKGEKGRVQSLTSGETRPITVLFSGATVGSEFFRQLYAFRGRYRSPILLSFLFLSSLLPPS